MSTELYEFCLRCHRKLKSEDAKRLGYGKICYQKAKQASTKKRLFSIKPLEKDANM